MSNQGYYENSQGFNHPPADNNGQHSNNPFANPWSDTESPQSQSQTHIQNQNPYQQSGYTSPQPQQYPQQNSSAPPTGLPPANSYQQSQPTQPNIGGGTLQRKPSFNETDFIPASERGEQREAMEQFEMNAEGTRESQQDRDVAMLQREFPGLDGSLIAAIHADSGEMGASREMLRELASTVDGEGR